ncbi:hypothetical protein [Alkalibacillus silvisoli]|uniref:Uncharacterized protein n=1 Tax=Alkalibacillus silvisoli TaxID=392823 RepID=A0ABN1A6Y6_9BACI
MKNIEDEIYSFEEFVKSIDKTKKINPFEKNYQVVITDVLEKLLVNTDIQVADVSANKNTEIHNGDNYIGESGPPDLLLVPQEYRHNNKHDEERNPKPIAAIEVKNPEERKNVSEFVAKLKNDPIQQLASHLTKNKKVIVTDCIKWCFFENNNSDKRVDFMLVESFNLKDDFGEWKVPTKKENEFVQEPLEIEKDYVGTECKEWNELQNYIRKWVLQN